MKGQFHDSPLGFNLLMKVHGVRVLILLAIGLASIAEAQPLKYPASKTVAVVDDYHGTAVADPYRWLEDADAEDTQAWVAAQNQLTFSYLQAIPARETIKRRLTELWNYPKYGPPVKEGGRYFFTKNDGLQNQSVLYVQDKLDGPPRPLIDPNTLSADGTIAMTTWTASVNGKHVAYGLSRGGSDWQEVKIRNVDLGADYDEVLQWCRFASIAWTHDHKGFYYDRYPEPGSVPEEDQSKYNRVYYHVLGTPQAQDKLIYERPDDKELSFGPQITEDGKYLVLYVFRGTDTKNRIYYRRVDSDRPFIKLLDAADANYTLINNQGTLFYFRTDADAPRGRIIAIDLTKPERENWREILPQQQDVVDFAVMAKDQLVVCFMHDAHHLLKVYSRQGKFLREIALPAIGTIVNLSSKRDDIEMFFDFASFLFPTTVYRYDFNPGKLEVFLGPKVNIDPSRFETRQVFYPSKDGTQTPMFLIHKKNLPLNGNNPALLYGYGGFNVSLTPTYSTPYVLWIENGGVLAIPNLRGGGEYGEAWHQAGMLEKKQNVFDDFIAAAEWLLAQGYTNRTKLAINGGSNGGLLVAACLTQRPELFGAAVCQVPVIDMLRYHQLTVGHWWIPEYGSADNPDQFKFLYAYSPLHNVKAATSYPPTLITSADTDDRVVAAHAKKFAATVQTAQSSSNPILIRIETKAGHGQGKPTSKRIEEATDIYAFLFKIFDMSPPALN
jgi:prolyl oligopeptidase